MIKVLHVNHSDARGGAARAARRLHRALIEAGVNSEMFVQDKQLDDPTIHGPRSRWSKLLIKARDFASEQILRLQDSTNPILHSLNIFPTGCTRRINKFDADLVNLHWVNHEMISVPEIGRIKKPIVWTLHDAWPLCGAEHHVPISNDDRRFRDGYRRSNREKESRGVDLDRWVWTRKRKHWSDLNVTLVAPSRWLANMARASVLFSDARTVVIPNALNTDVYKPITRATARHILNLPVDKRIVLFGAVNATAAPIKGFDLLSKAIRQVSRNCSDVLVVVFGAGKGPGKENFGCDVRYIGHLYDAYTLTLTYSAADVMVVPSKVEAFGQTASEAMACGTPVAAFKTTGLMDIVDHKINGYLATPYEVMDLAKGVEWGMKAGSEVSEAARSKVTSAFDSQVVADRYTDLYQDIVSESE